jgi:hypothetical protein
MASRAVDSQQTLVKVPAISRLSIPRLRNLASISDEPDMKALNLIFLTRRSAGSASSFG